MTFSSTQLPSPVPHVTANLLIQELVKTVGRTNESAYLVTLSERSDEDVKLTSLSGLFDCVSLITVNYADNYDDRSLELFWTA